MAWKCVSQETMSYFPIHTYTYIIHILYILQMGRQRKYRGKGKMVKMYRHSANKNE